AERRRRAEAERKRRAEEERIRRIKEQIKKEKKAERKRAFKVFRGRALICLVMFVIFAALAAGIFAIAYFRAPDKMSKKVTYVYGGAVYRTASRDVAFRDGKLYVCFNDVAAYLGLSVSGDTDSMKFVFPKTGAASDDGGDGYVRFRADSSLAELNDQYVDLPADSFMSGEEIWVSADFISDYVEGLDVTSSKDRVRVSRIRDEEAGDVSEPVYLEVSLTLKDSSPVPDPMGDGEGGKTMVPLEFKNDLSAYEEYMAPEDDAEFLLLVNAAHPLDGSFIPTDLVEVTNTRQDGRETALLRTTAAKALEALFIEMRSDGIGDVSVTSAYRSFGDQDVLHNNYINEEMAADPELTWEAAKAKVLTYSSEAGTSEHQTGLCVDMHNLDSADISFAGTDAYRWLCDNAWKFGFIERFPQDKTDVTGVSFEPWHWRFVGRAAAEEISASGKCLEEYTAEKPIKE
ncbi:MAG: D-alanyl-D-alanine carboxypeptidase family protein, partial [Clostridia bacterium]|nr:D-alanyl-D-alanine carboxypeptidase family protein [Clostridia bacterium]